MDIQNSGVEDRDKWRERITRALKELRGDDSRNVGRLREEADERDSLDS